MRTTLLCLVSAHAAFAAGDGARGEQLYLSQCSICHGQRGEGGRGSSLNRPRLRQAPDDETLERVIRRGIAGTGMPSSWLTEQEAPLVAAYVRKLGPVNAGRVAGDARRGEVVFGGKGGCGRCHTVNGHGGAFGPDLTAIGDRRGAAHLRESIVNPGADISPGYFEIRAVTREGSAVTGVRVNEDSFSIQLRDAAGKMHSMWKSELKSLDKDLKKSPMPRYAEGFFAASELDDLVAYLAQLTEEPAR